MDPVFEPYTGQSAQVSARHARHALARTDTSAFVAARHLRDADVTGGQLLTGSVSARHARHARVSALADAVICRHLHGAQARAVPLWTANVTASRAPWRALASQYAVAVLADVPTPHVVAAPGALQPTVGVVSSRYAHGAAATGHETNQDAVRAKRARHALATELVGGMVRAQRRRGALAYAPVPFSGLIFAAAMPTLGVTQGGAAVNTLQDVVTTGDAVLPDAVLALLDLFQLSDSYSQLAQALQALADDLTLADVAQMIWQADLLDRFIASAVPAGMAQITVLLRDGFDLADGATALSQILAAIADGFYVGLTLSTGQDTYTAWVMTPETKAVRTYSNYPFNSFAQLGEAFYGAGDAGVYQMGGATDAGTAIQAAVRSGWMDLGSKKMKRIDRAYIGATASGDLLLRVQATTFDDTLLEQTYRMVPAVTDGPREHRVTVGRGFRSVYWTFELANDVDGADFDLHDLEVLPMVLSGRVL